jgi:hypothetical protein
MLRVSVCAVVTRRTLGSSIALLCAAGLALTACGSDQPSKADVTAATSETPTTSPTPTPSAPPPPECSAVWQSGHALPKPYRGCLSAGKVIEPHQLLCSSGQTLFLFDDRFFAVGGGTITKVDPPLRKDPKYLATVQRCRG